MVYYLYFVCAYIKHSDAVYYTILHNTYIIYVTHMYYATLYNKLHHCALYMHIQNMP